MERHDERTAADLARARGWQIGDVIESDRGDRVIRVRVTAVRDGVVSGTVVGTRPAGGSAHDWVPVFPPESWVAAGADVLSAYRKVE